MCNCSQESIHNYGPCDENCDSLKPIAFIETSVTCNGHELIYEDGSGYICRHCGKDLSYEPDEEN